MHVLAASLMIVSTTFRMDVPGGATVKRVFTSNRKSIGHISIANRHLSGAILHSLCIFNRKFKRKLAFLLQFVTVSSGIISAHSTVPAHVK